MIDEHVVITSPTFYGAFGIITGQWPGGPGKSWVATRYEVLMPGYGTVTLHEWEFMTLTIEMEEVMEFPSPQLCLDRMSILQYDKRAIQCFEIGWHDKAASAIWIAEKMRNNIGEPIGPTIYEWKVTV